MNVESLKKIKQLTEKNIEDLGKKTDVSAAETKAAVDGFELLAWLEGKIEECEMKEHPDPQYSGCDPYSQPYAQPRRYNITSYRQSPGMPRVSYGDSMSYNGGYYGNQYRSSMMGSRMDASYQDDRGYSRHSINDRAVACLERMMDEASSDYERQQVHHFIEMIRAAE